MRFIRTIREIRGLTGKILSKAPDGKVALSAVRETMPVAAELKPPHPGPLPLEKGEGRKDGAH